jgi:hypothetical protein
MVEPDGVLNDLRTASMAFTQRGGSTHPAMAVQRLLTCQYPPMNANEQGNPLLNRAP